jgi:hypothetical protein
VVQTIALMVKVDEARVYRPLLAWMSEQSVSTQHEHSQHTLASSMTLVLTTSRGQVTAPANPPAIEPHIAA